MKKAGKLLKNLLRKKIFYFTSVAMVIGVAMCSHFFIHPVQAKPPCTSSGCPGDPYGGDGTHAIYTAGPTSLIVGRPEAIIEVTGCNLHEPTSPAEKSRNRYLLRQVGSAAGPDDIEATYGYSDGDNMILAFDLGTATPGYYTLIHYYQQKTSCIPETWDPVPDGQELPEPPYEYYDLPHVPPGDYKPKVAYGDPILIYSPAIVGWGWFGAATPGDQSCRDSHGLGFPCGSPAWMSLNCLSDTVSGPSGNRCYNAVENPTGVDYGLSLFYDIDHFNINGQSWLGIHSDNDANPANNTALGWTYFDPTIINPVVNPADLYDSVPNVPGTVTTKARYNEDTGEVSGWARIQTLREEGKNTRCTATARDWSANPTSLMGSLDGTASRIAEAPDRGLHATWVGPGPDESVYYDNQIGGSWLLNPVNLTSIVGDTNNFASDIAVKSDGTIYVSYIYNNTVIRLFSCSSSCDIPANWTYSDAVTVASGLSDQSLAVTKDTNRAIYVYYQQDNDVYIVTSADGQSWTSPVQISNPSTASQPRLAVDFQDNVHVVWQSGSDIYYRRYTNGVDWSPALTLPGTKVNVLGNSARPSITVDPEANPHVVYETAPNIVYRKHTPTGGWYQEVSISSGTNDTHPVIAYSNDYRAHVLYQDDAHAPNKKILHTESTNGRDWSPPNPIYNENTINQLSPDAIVAKNNYVNALFSRPGDVIHQSVSTGTYGAACDDPTAGTDVSGTDWGWVSLRGGLGGYATTQDYANALEAIGPGFRACYACDEVAMTCKICEILDQDYGAPTPTSPPRYACNVCSNCAVCSNDLNRACSDPVADCVGNGNTCVPNKKCSRTGTACDDANPCEWTEGEMNECVMACVTCDTCNTWGVSIDGDLATGANFHGYGWSAGGTVDIDPDYPAGSFDSGSLQMEGSINEGSDGAGCETGGCSCNSLAECRTWGWIAEDASTPDQICANKAYFNPETPDDWGACVIQLNPNPLITITKKLSTLTQTQNLEAGNYFLSLTGLFDQADVEKPTITVTDGSTTTVLTGADLATVGIEQKSCTFGTQVYLTKDSTLTFSLAPGSSSIFMDYFKITSLPVEAVDCQTGLTLAETYIDEVGFGFMDYSNVSTLKPWVQTQYGNIYSKSQIGPGGGAPAGSFNSTYIIGTPKNVPIEGGWIMVNDPNYFRAGLETEFGLPGPASSYRSPLGKIPYAELSKPAGSNPYSDRVIEFNQDSTPACPENGSILWSQVKRDVIPVNGKGPLQKGVYHFGRRNEACNLVIDEEMELENGNGQNGSGTFLIEGDLIVDANITVKDTGNPIQVISELASVGFIVKGNVKIKGAVTELVGAYVAIGCDSSGAPPEDGNCQGAPASHAGLFDTAYDAGSSSDQLKLSGVVIAYRYDFGRTFSGLEGSELFINDGKTQANPPPGFSSIATATKLSAERPFD